MAWKRFAYWTRLRLPDLLLTDFSMPEMDGLELAAVVRERLNIPVMFLTAQLSPACTIWDEHLCKPLDIDRLVATVRRLLAWAPMPVRTRAGGAARLL